MCGYKGMFMDVECWGPGSLHDSKVFTVASINKMLRNGEIPATLQTVIHGCERNPYYLIGDSAYPFTPFCMKEFDNCNSNEEVIFNNMLRSPRNQVECSFERSKARWAMVTRKMELKLEILPTVIYTCFILHNYCEKNKLYVDEEVFKSQKEIVKNNEENYKKYFRPQIFI